MATETPLADADPDVSGQSDGPSPPGARASTREERRARALFIAAVIIAIVPLVVAAVRAIHAHVLPLGDDAFFELRARDVFSHHIPLLGTWTSASQSTGVNLNNPGPLYFYLLAAPVKLFNHDGLIAGVALINIAAVLVTAWFAHRRGGALVGAGAMAMAAGLTWTMGSTLVVDVWQPHALLLPFLCLLVLVWSMACGDLVALPVAAFVASFVVQTHLSYAVLVPVLVVWGCAALVLSLHRAGRHWRDARRPVIGAAIVAVVCWAPPLLEELQHGSDGNLSRIVSTIGKAKDTIGLSFGVRLVAAIVSVPPWWLRPSFGSTFVPVTNHHPGIAVARNLVPSIGVALITLAVLAALVAVVTRRARRQDDSTSLMVLGTTAVAVVGAVLTATTLPIGFFGIAPHQLRWLWPISIFVLFAVAVALARWSRVRRR